VPLDQTSGGTGQLTMKGPNGEPIVFNGEDSQAFFRKLLGVAPTIPPFVFRDVGYGNVVKKTLMIHKQQGTDIVTGGKSPGWVNMAITFAIRYGLSQLAQAIAFVGEAPGAEGLDNLYQGQLDDVFLAFMRFTNPFRSADAGSYAFREYFEQGDGSAYTINSIGTLASGDYKMRAYVSMKFDVGVGPLIWGEDLRARRPADGRDSGRVLRRPNPVGQVHRVAHRIGGARRCRSATTAARRTRFPARSAPSATSAILLRLLATGGDMF